MRKKTIKLCIYMELGILLCAVIFLAGMFIHEHLAENTQSAGGNKTPDMYTWEEYQSLSLEEQDIFFQWFDSVDSFETWMEKVKPAESTDPLFNWDKPGKQPNAYTWEEYQALSLEDQDAFFQWFDSTSSFEAWMEKVKPVETTTPVSNWNKPGKQPNEYTWEEYQALSSKEQEAFYQWFDSTSSFEAWMERVKPVETTTPVPDWNKPGKQPNEYTWEEYQALSPKDQDTFYQWFGSIEMFEAWMERVKSVETTTPVPDWNKPGKQPNEYTWEEYQALSFEDQDAFYQWFGSIEMFEAWMERVKSVETTTPVLDWNKPGKQPNEYTWEEYQALSPKDQDAFYQWFGSIDVFEAWMEGVKPTESTAPALVWDKSGRQPNEYTWEEYQALSPEEQEAFYQWFDSKDAFEVWLDVATGMSSEE